MLNQRNSERLFGSLSFLWCSMLWLPISAFAGFFVVEQPTAEQVSDYLETNEGGRKDNQQPMNTRRLSQSVPDIWRTKAGSTLRESVLAWGRKAGWEVYWRADDLDYPILGDWVYEGLFEAAIKQIFNAHEKVDRPLLVDGNSRQKVLVIREKK